MKLVAAFAVIIVKPENIHYAANRCEQYQQRAEINAGGDKMMLPTHSENLILRRRVFSIEVLAIHVITFKYLLWVDVAAIFRKKQSIEKNNNCIS